jgi:hypothetical protein
VPVGFVKNGSKQMDWVWIDPRGGNGHVPAPIGAKPEPDPNPRVLLPSLTKKWHAPEPDPNPHVLLSSLAKIFYIRLISGVRRVTRGCDLKPEPAQKNTQIRFK